MEAAPVWTRPTTTDLEMVSSGDQTVMLSGAQVWGVRQEQWVEGARDLQPSHPAQDVYFVRSVEWSDRRFLLICFKMNQCMLYTTWFGYDFKYRQTISDTRMPSSVKEPPTPVDAKFFKQNDSLFLVVIFQQFRTISETQIYRWYGTYFDLETTPDMGSTAASVETFPHGKSTLLILGCRGDNKVKFPVQVWRREHSGQMTKVQHLPTVSPVSITHFVERGENFILVIEKNLNPVIYWWAGCEFVEWMRLDERFKYYNVRASQGQNHSYLIFTHDNVMKVHIMTVNNLEQIYAREFINWNSQKLYILNELMYKDTGKDYMLMHFKTQDEVLVTLFKVQINHTYVPIEGGERGEREEEDSVMTMSERLHRVSLINGGLEDRLAELNKRLPTLLLTNKAAELPASIIRVPAAEVRGGNILNMTNTHLGITGHMQHIISKISRLEKDIKAYTDQLKTVQIHANRHLNFVGNVHLKQANFSSLHATVVNGKEFKPDTFLSTKDNTRLKELDVKILRVDWLVLEKIGRKQVKDFVLEDAIVKVPVKTAWLQATQLNMKEDSSINNITTSDLINKAVAVEMAGKNFNQVAQVGGVGRGRGQQPTTLQLLDHSLISDLYVDRIDHISVSQLLHSLFSQDNNIIHGNLIFNNGVRVGHVINRSRQTAPPGVHEKLGPNTPHDSQSIPDRFGPDKSGSDHDLPPQMIPEKNIPPHFNPNMEYVPVLYPKAPFQIISGVRPVVQGPPLIYPFHKHPPYIPGPPQIIPYAQFPPKFIYGMPHQLPPHSFYPRPQYQPQIHPHIRYILPAVRNKRDVHSRKNSFERIYKNKVTIHGNLKVDRLLFRNSSLKVSKHSVPLQSLDKIFWTHNTPQVISNPVHVNNGVTVLHHLNGPIINGKNLNSFSTKSSIKYVNVRHLNISLINDKDLKHVLDVKRLTEGGLRILTGNLKVDGDINANSINGINVQKKLNTAVMIQERTGRQDITFKNVSANHMTVDIINGQSMDSWQNSEHPSVRVQGRILLAGKLSVSAINSKPTNFSQVVNKSKGATIYGRKQFSRILTVTNHIKINMMNSVNIGDFMKNVLRNSSNQEISGMFSLHRATIRSLTNVSTINRVNTSKFVYINNPLVNLTGNFYFSSVRIEGHIITDKLLDSCNLPKLTSTSAEELVFTGKSKLSSLTVTGDSSWLRTGNGTLQHLLASAVTATGDQIITGDLVFSDLYVGSPHINSLNDKNISFIIQDTFSRSKPNQIISGKKHFRKMQCKKILVKGNTKLLKVNKVEINDINQRIVRHNVEYGRTIAGHKKFISGFKTFMLKCPGGINGITAENLVTEKYVGTLPPLTVSSLTVLNYSHLEEVNGLHINKFLRDCIYLNQTSTQFLKEELKIIGNVTLEGAMTFNSVNNISHNQLIFTKTGDIPISVKGCKTFSRNIDIEGDSNITMVNGNNLVENYKSNIKRYENVTIKGAMVLSEVELDTIFAQEYFVGNQQLFLNKTFVP